MESTSLPEVVTQPFAVDWNANSALSDKVSPTSPSSSRAFATHIHQDDTRAPRDLVRAQTRSSVALSPAGSRNTSVGPSDSTRPSSISEWTESPFSEPFLSGKLDVFDISLPFSWKGTSVGLSNDCTSAYFFRERSITIFPLPSAQTQQNQHKIEHTFTDDVYLRDVAVSDHYVAALTHEHLVLLRYCSDAEESQQAELQTSVSVQWDPKGLAIYENKDCVSVLVGERRQGSRGWEGRIKLYHYPLQNNGGRRIQEIQTFRTIVGGSTNDAPKTLAFHFNGKGFVCITKGVVSNAGFLSSILVWSLDNEMAKAQRPFEISYKYTVVCMEGDKTGITSACLFDSPSGKSYVLSTSYPSTERHSNEGEWSFISPVDCSPNSTMGLRPLTHRLEQLAEHKIQCGAVPRQGNLVAFLEETGNVTYVPLTAGDRAGLSSQHPLRLPVSLCPQQKLSMGCLRFDPSGTILYAIDSKGRLIRATFTQVTANSNASAELHELDTRERLEIGPRVDQQEELRPDHDDSDTSMSSRGPRGRQAVRLGFGGLLPRKTRRSHWRLLESIRVP